MPLSAAMQDLLSRQARLLQAALDGHSQLVQLWELMEVEAEGPPMGPMQRFSQTRSEAALAGPLAASQELTQVTGPPSPVLQQPTLSTPPHVQQAAKRPLSPDTTRVHPAHPQAWPPPILAGCGQCATRVMDPALARSVQSIGPPEGPSTARIGSALHHLLPERRREILCFVPLRRPPRGFPRRHPRGRGAAEGSRRIRPLADQAQALSGP